MRRAVMQDLARLDTDVGAEEVALDDVTKKYHALVASQQAAVRSQRGAGTVLCEVRFGRCATRTPINRRQIPGNPVVDPIAERRVPMPGL